MALPFIPWRAPVIQDLKDKLIGSDAWGQWVIALQRAVDSSAIGTGAPQNLTAQAAAIAGTTLLTVPTTGLYRVSFYERVTRAAGTSSGVVAVVFWTDGGVACFQAGANLVANTTATNDSQSFLVRADQGTLITIATLYSSIGAPSMLYSLDARVEAVP